MLLWHINKFFILIALLGCYIRVLVRPLCNILKSEHLNFPLINVILYMHLYVHIMYIGLYVCIILCVYLLICLSICVLGACSGLWWASGEV